ncbi:coatomer WD associated region-domain-containing protein [Lentinula raphanica]|uniref:Coatomer subunit beta' n=1 Tax=Lentinula raphanica TaxID=153919 RepID=A0AA38PDJ4_9AGAR|nr:coatomer WD associated region-domain-containing protein [Lentinula raphanica]KAJ3840953.1 coatomer WD associated region-domain-containing protein [Lentinula raphanica]
MLFEVNRKLFSRSDRVKGVDFHPTEPWVLTGLYNGQVHIYHAETGALLKTFEVADVPVRCIKFIARKNWFVAGSDDFQLRVFNYNTHEKVASFEAHPDYIRCLAVHPTLSLVLTGSDDMTIKAWDWEKGWKNVQMYQGHTHYIMNIAFNPKDTNTFASACLDRTVKIWSISTISSTSSPQANFTLDAHEKGVNYVDFYPGNDKPYLVTCGDDKTVKVWDYLSKSCVQTMEGHTNNVSFSVFHPSLPVIISGAEDGTVKIWNANTYRIENTLSYALERAWCVALHRTANEVAVGYDEGLVVIKLGKDEPTFSVDSSGKMIYTKSSAVLSANLSLVDDSSLSDGQRVQLSSKEIGSSEVFPTAILHSPNGRWVTVVGDGEWIIYTALAWRNKSFGNGFSFAWGPDSNTYAVLESKVNLKLFKNFKEKPGVIKGTGSWGMDALYGGPLLSARGNGFVIFWDWETGEIVRRIDVDAKNIYWSTNNTLVAITSDDSFYILRFDRDAYEAKLAEGGLENSDEGAEEAFEVIADVQESVKTAKWIGDCFIYTTSSNRLMYFVGNESYSISPLDTPLYLLSYLPAHNRVYLTDKDLNVYTYHLSLAVVEYQIAVIKGEMEEAAGIFKDGIEKGLIGREGRGRLARFLEGRDLKELALQIATDPDHKFDLALQLDDLDTALEIVQAESEVSLPTPPELEPTPTKSTEINPESITKWKALGDRALAAWRFDLAKECFENAGDLSALMLLLMSMGVQGQDELLKLAERAEKEGQNNLAWAIWWSMGEKERCVDLLIKTERVSEAAMLARTYAPSLVPKTVLAWKADLTARGRPKIADMIANPDVNPELFGEGWAGVLEKEKDHGSASPVVSTPQTDSPVLVDVGA